MLGGVIIFFVWLKREKRVSKMCVCVCVCRERRGGGVRELES